MKQSMQKRAFIAIGSNLGNPLQQIDKACLSLNAHPQIKCRQLSKVYQSKPHGPQNQPKFMNAVVEIITNLMPQQLLLALQAIEDEHGRKRTEHWGARTLDLDIVWYEGSEIQSDSLTIPHSHAHLREFVVVPLLDLDTTLVLPKHGRLEEIVNQLPVENLEVIRDVTTHYR